MANLGADALRTHGRQQRARHYGQAYTHLAGSKTPGMHGNIVCETREALRLALPIAARPAWCTTTGARSYEEHSGPGSNGGGRGGKGAGQGQLGPAQQGPDAVPGRSVTGAGPGTPGSKGARHTVDGAVASCLRHRPTAGGLQQPQARCSSGGGWPDMGRLRSATRNHPSGVVRPPEAGSVSGPTGRAHLRRKLLVASDPPASRRWKTTSSSGRQSRGSTPSTSKSFSGSRTVPAQDAARTTRWMRSR